MRALFFFLLAVTAAASGDIPGAAGKLRASAEPAVILLEPRSGEQQYLQLPNLEFGLSLEPRCEPDAEVRAIVVSVADTRLRLDARELDDTAMLATAFLLPGQQAGRLRVDGFCRASGPDIGSRLEVKDAFTARLSLRCGDDNRESVTYATLPLDLVLECRAAAATEEERAPPAQSSLRF